MKNYAYIAARTVKNKTVLASKRIKRFIYRNRICTDELIDGFLEQKWEKKNISCIVPQCESVDSDVQLSIIIPLYNSEKFIHKCVGSFIHQDTDYKYEILLINDGSKDSTEDLAKLYERKYPEKVRVIHQQNQGISAARNTGIENALGRYIGFADHDDWVENTYVEKLLKVAIAEAADIVKCGFSTVRYGEVIEKDQMVYKKYVGDIKNELFELPGFIWGGIYKKELFARVRFPVGYWYEDMVSWILIYRRSKLFINIPEALYCKLIHENNASKKVWSEKDYKCLEQLYLAEIMIEDNKKLHLPEDVIFFQCMVQELSRMLSYRTRGIPEETRVQVFLYAKKVLAALYKAEYENEMLAEYKEFNEIVLNGKYEAWKELI